MFDNPLFFNCYFSLSMFSKFKRETGIKKLAYDKDVYSACIYIANKISKDQVKKTKGLNENIILDFD